MINEFIEMEIEYRIKKRLESIGFEVFIGDGWFELKKKNRIWEFEFSYQYEFGLFMFSLCNGKWFFLQKTVIKIIMDEMKLLNIDNLIFFDMPSYQMIELCYPHGGDFPAIPTGETAKKLLELALDLDIMKKYNESWYKIRRSILMNADLYLRFSWGLDPKIDLIYCNTKQKKIEKSLRYSTKYVYGECRNQNDILLFKKEENETETYISYGELSTKEITSSGEFYIKPGVDHEPILQFEKKKEEEIQHFIIKIKEYILKKDNDAIFFEDESNQENIICNLFDDIKIFSIVKYMNAGVFREPSDIEYRYRLSIGGFYSNEEKSLEMLFLLIKERIDNIAKTKRLSLLYNTEREGNIISLKYELNQRSIGKIYSSLSNEAINQHLTPFYKKGNRIKASKYQTRFVKVNDLLIYKVDNDLIIETDPEKLLLWLATE